LHDLITSRLIIIALHHNVDVNETQDVDPGTNTNQPLQVRQGIFTHATQ